LRGFWREEITKLGVNVTKFTKIQEFYKQMTKINKKNFEKACKGSGGVGAVVARSLGVTRQAIYTFLKRNPEMREFLDEEGQQILDIAEHNIDKEILAGNVEISMWALLNRKAGRARGYGSRQVMGNADVRPFIVKITEKSDEEIKEKD